MNFIISVICFLIFLKLFLFWLWLWQLKEYHTGRFLAHFESQKFVKIVSSFWRLKYPKFTKKTIVILLGAILFGIVWCFYLNGYSLVIFAPIISSLLILLFQIPTVILRGRTIQKAKQKREQFKDLLVIGITGSYGKTSTKEFLYTILIEKLSVNKVLKTKEHQNSEVGISKCILNDLKPEHKIFICEMGAYNKGGIKFLCDIAKPKIGILTGINEQHMSTFGSQENIIKTKYELIESLPQDGMVFFNAKNKYCLELYEKAKIKKILYGQEAKFYGEENILGAIAVAKELGMTEEEIKRGLDKIENKMPGINIKKGVNGLNIIDSTYSANPDGVIANLEYLTLRFPQGKKIIIMPCLIELGKASAEVHKRIGKKIGEVCDLAIITTKDRFKEIKAVSAEATAGRRPVEVLYIDNPQEIFEKIKSFCQPGDVVLLESRIPKKLIQQLTVNN